MDRLEAAVREGDVYLILVARDVVESAAMDYAAARVQNAAKKRGYKVGTPWHIVTAVADGPEEVDEKPKPFSTISDVWRKLASMEERQLNSSTLKVGGEPFYCGCGCNVFLRTLWYEEPNYRCNACDRAYGGTD
jgi:hypothetical protein